MQKDEIICRTKELFDKSGVHSITLNMILEYLGISKGNFYYYFESKDDLIYQVISPIIKEKNNKIKKNILILDSLQAKLRQFFLPLVDDELSEELEHIEQFYSFLFFEGNINKNKFFKKLYMDNNKQRKILLLHALKLNNIKITKEMNIFLNYIVDTIMFYNILYKNIYNKSPKKEIDEFIEIVCSLVLQSKKEAKQENKAKVDLCKRDKANVKQQN